MNFIEITSQSIDDLKQVLNEQGITGNSLRVNVNIGWGGTAFYLALDEPKDKDLVQEIDGLKFVVSPILHQIYQGFNVESVQNGSRILFRILPKVDDQNSGGCASCTSCN